MPYELLMSLTVGVSRRSDPPLHQLRASAITPISEGRAQRVKGSSSTQTRREPTGNVPCVRSENPSFRPRFVDALREAD